MEFADGGRTRLAEAVAAARRLAGAVRGADGSYLVYDFASSRRAWGIYVPGEKDLKTGERDRTRAAEALAELNRLFGRGGLAAVALVSDGVWDAQPAAAGLPPVYTLVTGARPPAGMVFPEEAKAAAVVTPGTKAEVRLKYYSTLPDGAPATVNVAEEGGGAASFTVKTKAGANEAAAPLAAGAPGDHFYRLRVTPGAGEAWVHTRVLTWPLVIWYREMAGDADFSFLKRALASNAGFDLKYNLELNGGSVPAAAAPPERANVIIYGNPRVNRITAADAGALERHVAEGGGLLIVTSAGPPDTAALAGPLGRLAPIVPSGAAAEAPGGVLVPAAWPGAPAVMAAPPAVSYTWRLGELKATAAPVWKTPGGVPALVIGRYGLGRVGLLAAGGFYKRQLAVGGEELARWAAALVLALYGDASEPLTLSRPLASPDEVVELTVRATVEPTVVVADPRGEVATVATSPVGEGLWAGEIQPEGPGRYDVTARIPDARAEVAKASFVAVPPAEEGRAFRPRPERLAALAAATGGRAFGPGALEEMATAVAARVRAQPRLATTEERAIWPAWLAFTLALACLAAEWFTRRRAGLK